jgi:hypothetical protein
MFVAGLRARRLAHRPRICAPESLATPAHHDRRARRITCHAVLNRTTGATQPRGVRVGLRRLGRSFRAGGLCARRLGLGRRRPRRCGRRPRPLLHRPKRSQRDPRARRPELPRHRCSTPSPRDQEPRRAANSAATRYALPRRPRSLPRGRMRQRSPTCGADAVACPADRAVCIGASAAELSLHGTRRSGPSRCGHVGLLTFFPAWAAPAFGGGGAAVRGGAIPDGGSGGSPPASARRRRTK